MQGYNLKIKKFEFEGPLSLLLELIEKKKLDVTKLSLVEVADDFLDFIKDKNEVTLDNLSEFILIASHLILLKSRHLLPFFEFTKEEEEEIDDLEERLKEYQRFKKARDELKKLFEKKQFSFSREGSAPVQLPIFSQKIDVNELRDLYLEVLQNIPKEEENLEKDEIREVVSLKEKITELHQSIKKRIKIAFHEAIVNKKDKGEVVVTFLAMLEMVKQQAVFVEQNEIFGEIMIRRRE